MVRARNLATPFFASSLSAALALASLAAGTLKAQPIARLGAIGDSLTDEYAEESYDYARSWTELLAEEQGLTLGPTAAGQPGGTWGEPRRTGYEDNWARYGITSDGSLAAGAHTGLAAGARERGVSHAAIYLGGNDFSPWAGAYASIYDGSWNASQIDAWIAGRAANLETMLAELKPTGVKLVLASILDFSAMPYISEGSFTDPVGRERVAAALAEMRDTARGLAQEWRIGFLDLYALNRTLFGPATAPRPSLLVGNVAIDLDGRDTTSGTVPSAAWVDDGIHPNTVLQGIWANAFATAFNRAFDAGAPLFSEAEILANAGLAYGGSDTLAGQIGPLAQYAESFVAGTSLRFHGNGVAAPELDRVKIPLDAPARPVDIGVGDFTVELWIKMQPGANDADWPCTGANDDWIHGNIFLDRDVFGNGDFGDWGVSLSEGRAMFGVASGASGVTACGATDLADGAWHHLALTRRLSDGRLEVWLDGALDGSADGPEGNLSYRDGRSGAEDDPFLVIGAEKHDAGAQYPSFSGWIDEFRISTVRRYTSTFAPSATPFATDASTAALYHFDEAAGTVVGDTSGAAGGPSNGTRNFGGSPPGPEWSSDTPFNAIFADGFETGDTSAWSAVIVP